MKKTARSGGQTWLAKQAKVSQQRISELVVEGRIKKKTSYGEKDAQAVRAMLDDARDGNNATAGADEHTAAAVAEDAGNDEAIRALSKNPERIARIKLLIERTAKIKLERELLAGGYLKKEDVERDRSSRIFSVRAKLQEIPLRASLIAHKSESEAERILTDWVREACDYYANGGN